MAHVYVPLAVCFVSDIVIEWRAKNACSLSFVVCGFRWILSGSSCTSTMWPAVVRRLCCLSRVPDYNVFHVSSMSVYLL